MLLNTNFICHTPCPKRLLSLRDTYRSTSSFAVMQHFTVHHISLLYISSFLTAQPPPMGYIISISKEFFMYLFNDFKLSINYRLNRLRRFWYKVYAEARSIRIWGFQKQQGNKTQTPSIKLADYQQHRCSYTTS